MNLFLNYYTFLSLLKNPIGVQLAYLFSEYFNYSRMRLFLNVPNLNFSIVRS